MKYSNLTSAEKILKWFKKYPMTINEKCPIDGHIIDWILGGYRGHNLAKKTLIDSLVKESVDFLTVKPDTFYKLLTLFTNSYRTNKEPSYKGVLQTILKANDQLVLIKNDHLLLNSLLNDYHFSPDTCDYLYQEILFKEIPLINVPVVDKEQYSNHPLIFTLTDYLLMFDVLNPSTHSQHVELLKINKIHELTENLHYEKIPFICNTQNYFSIDDKGSVLDALKKIKTVLENFEEPSLNKSISLIDDTIKRDLYRSLNSQLPHSQAEIKKTKI